MMMDLNNINMQALRDIVLRAGDAILHIYNQPELSVIYKSDHSPLTQADTASHEVIMEGLKTHWPDIPVLSEEGSSIPFEERKQWGCFWCVDPLDGTKEFIKRNGEFTVNIALIQDQLPVLGVIYVPVKGVMYVGSQREGAWKIDQNGHKIPLQTKRKNSDWVAVGSRTHASAEEEEVLAQYPVVEKMSVGSSIKFCLLAEGLAQIYYRQGPTMEWDTAAGQAILTYSGGTMTTPSGAPFLYNKESLLNGGFICKA